MLPTPGMPMRFRSWITNAAERCRVAPGTAMATGASRAQSCGVSTDGLGPAAAFPAVPRLPRER